MIHRRQLTIALPALLLGAADRTPIAATPISRMDTRWWRDRHLEKLEALRSGRVELIWLGDSITQDWELSGPPAWRDFQPVWNRFYGDRHAVNLGFKGDSTAHLLWRMRNGELDGISPKLAIVLIGANNLGRVRWSADQTVAGIEAVLGELKQRLPGTHLLLLGVLPSIRSKWVTRTTREINATLAGRYGSGSSPTFLDLSPLFETDGTVDRTQFLDDELTPPDPPLHPTAQAQEKIAVAIEPYVARFMGDRIHAPSS